MPLNKPGTLPQNQGMVARQNPKSGSEKNWKRGVKEQQMHACCRNLWLFGILFPLFHGLAGVSCIKVIDQHADKLKQGDAGRMGRDTLTPHSHTLTHILKLPTWNNMVPTGLCNGATTSLATPPGLRIAQAGIPGRPTTCSRRAETNGPIPA